MVSNQLKRQGQVRLNSLKLFFCSALVFVSFTATAQNVAKDIASINKVYRETKQMTLTFDLKMYENYQTDIVFFSQRGIVKKYGKNIFQAFEDSECLNTDNYSVLVDKASLEVIYSPKKTTFSFDDPSVLLNIDSVLKVCRSTSFQKISDEVSSYSFVLSDDYPEYNKIVIFFNNRSFLMQKIVFYCQEDDISVHNEKEKLSKARIEINYRDIDLNPNLTAADFTYDKYLVRSDKTFKLKPGMKNYNLTVLSF